MVCPLPSADGPMSPEGLRWSVHAGKLHGKEVDFVATKSGHVLYVQATDEMFASEAGEREIAPLKST